MPMDYCNSGTELRPANFDDSVVVVISEIYPAPSGAKETREHAIENNLITICPTHFGFY